MLINSTIDFRQAVRRGPYAWPGGYPIYFVMDDGESFCFSCAKSESKYIVNSINNKDNDGWRVTGADINWEDEDLYCAHCCDKIESAYA
tara:strand:+ start:601 stop:867 length:267 start_codon:yes stop_codon:yes gene_type:complete